MTNGSFSLQVCPTRYEDHAGKSDACKLYSGYFDPTLDQRSYFICAYLDVLDSVKGQIWIDSELPFPKEQIERAIIDELHDGPDCDWRNRLEIAYIMLECFVNLDDYRTIEDFKSASLLANEQADTNDPLSILKSARILKKAKGAKAVRLEEKIFENLRKRQLEIMELR